ncbi:sulfate adenylyltransferase subunit CysD [soil metagenome]
MLELQDTTFGGEGLRVVENNTALTSQNDQLLKARRTGYLSVLEAESIQILREVAASFQRPALLFSGGKDSICLLRLAEKAFRPGKFPFPLVHVDTGHNFPEVIELRDRIVDRLCERLIVASVPEALSKGLIRETPGMVSRNRLQSPTLMAAIEKYNFDAAIGGARRDEEKARAKERIFSFRDPFGQWQPRSQRPELWNIYNTRVFPGEHMRVFPISNWTEFDVWDYIARERLELPSIYFAHYRNVVERDGQLLPVSEFLPPFPHETTRIAQVRMRTVGDMACTGCHLSEAATVPQIIAELSTMQIAERGSRTDDKQSDTAMEDRKKEGYF